MSFIRALEKRKYSKGRNDLYVYPTELDDKQYISFNCSLNISSEDYTEVLFRVLERCGIQFSIEDVNNIRQSLFLEPMKENKNGLSR